MNLDSLLSERIDHRFKGFPDTELTIGEAATAGWNLLAGDLMLPMMVLRQGPLEHNLTLMADWCSRHDASLAPHGKTTMAPQLYARQLAAGAWGISAATLSQVRVMRSVGIDRILLANELVSPAGIRWLGGELDRDEGFEFFCYVDSVEGVDRLDAASNVDRPLKVLVELGQAGGRSGVRDEAEALRLADRVNASERLTLAGGAAYEGLAAKDRAPETMAPVDALLDRLARFVEATGAGILSGGGSAYFDRVVAHAKGLDVRVVLRSGCYLTHDLGNYEYTSPLRSDLRPALELWAEVLSAPEPGLAIVGFGKRDAPYDVAPPTPLGLHRTGGRYEEVAGKARVVKLNDQHAFVQHELELRPGDVLRFGLTHPCTAFDKWQLIPIVDDDQTVVEAVRTLF